MKSPFFKKKKEKKDKTKNMKFGSTQELHIMGLLEYERNIF